MASNPDRVDPQPNPDPCGLWQKGEAGNARDAYDKRNGGKK